MRLTLETHFEGEWHYAATLEVQEDATGYQGASMDDYDLDYFVTAASAEFTAGKTVRDYRALSVRYPERLQKAPDMGRDMGASPEILERAMGRSREITDSLLAACS